MHATLYDGVTGHPHQVRVEVRDDGLDLSTDTDTDWTDRVPAGVLKRMDSPDSAVRLRRTDVPGWRLTLPSDAAAALAPLLGREERYGRWIDRIGLLPAAVGFGAIAVAVVAIGYLAPEWIAPNVPKSWERNLGDAIVGDFGDNRCRGAEGQRVLNGLVERLEPGATRGPDAIRIATLDFPIFNAAALPGGHVVIFQGALDEAENPDALAGIVAHEIAHVRRRHVTQALIRELGIGALIRLFAGDIGASAQELVALSYTRENEAQADSDAIAMLRRANISPKPTGELFDRLARDSGEEPGFTGEFLESHPLSRNRAKRFADAEQKGASYVPALTDEQFRALKLMCRSAEDRSAS